MCSPEDQRVARHPDRIDRFSPTVAGGCHCNRETKAAIVAAGFTLARIRRFDFRPKGWRAALTDVDTLYP
jgi:hypothetical protein